MIRFHQRLLYIQARNLGTPVSALFRSDPPTQQQMTRLLIGCLISLTCMFLSPMGV